MSAEIINYLLESAESEIERADKEELIDLIEYYNNLCTEALYGVDTPLYEYWTGLVGFLESVLESKK